MHPDLARVFLGVIEFEDCSILCGHRGREEQSLAFREKRSKVMWPYSRHNSLPAEAVDVMPYPIDWDDIPRIERFAKSVKDYAKSVNVPVEWGGDWVTFKDYPHWQLPKGYK